MSAFEVSPQGLEPSLSRYFAVSIFITDGKTGASGVGYGGSKGFSTTIFSADLIDLGTGRRRASSHVARLRQHISEGHRRGRIAGCCVHRDRGDLLARPILALVHYDALRNSYSTSIETLGTLRPPIRTKSVDGSARGCSCRTAMSGCSDSHLSRSA
jgi:hypothetical protein